MSHALERTSPKGPGQKFVGRCIKCGKDGLRLSDAYANCPADSIMSDEAALLHLVDPPAPTPQEPGEGA